MKALRFLPIVVLTLSGASAADQPLQAPSWLTPFLHEHDQILATPDHLHSSYDASEPSMVVVGHYETVLRQAGVKYNEGPDVNGGAIFRVSQNRTSCSVRIQGRTSNAGAHVDVECVLNPTAQAGPVAALDSPAPPTHSENRSAGTKQPVDLLQHTIRFSVLAKGFIPADPTANRFEALLTLNCSYQNISERDVRAFTGIVVFEDLFGREIFNTRLTVSDPIPVGQAATWNGTIHYNQFIEAQKRFLGTALENMKVVWVPASIIFSDGTQIGETR